MKQYDIAKENQLLRKLFILAAKRSMRPSMTDNKIMWLLLEELYLLTENEVYLKGVTVDYVRQGLNEGFEFLNPNERDRCGTVWPRITQTHIIDY